MSLVKQLKGDREKLRARYKKNAGELTLQNTVLKDRIEKKR